MLAEGVISDYAIGGAMGATFYVEPVMTMDLDIFIVSFDKCDLLPLQPIYSALKAKGYLPDEYEKECINIEGDASAVSSSLQCEKRKSSKAWREMPYAEKVRWVVEMQKRVAPIYASRGKIIVPWTNLP